MTYERPSRMARSGRGLRRLTHGACLAVLGVAAPLLAQPATQPTPIAASAARPLHTLVEAVLRADRIAFPVNSAVEMEFTLRNLTDEYVQLDVPLGPLLGKLPQGFALHGMGLPLEHIFSGRLFRALSIVGEGDPYLGDIVSRGPRRTIPSIMLAPFAEIGLKFDITRFYPVLKHEGRYDIQWHPYGDEIRSNTLTIEVRAQKQVVMETSQGRLTIHLLYDAAPATVEHFL
ncbi:MAG: hypothetical protein V3T70_04415, partial [Phycisphaerae bacterium]